MSRRIAVLGAGAFGTALACVLARTGRQVSLIDRNPDRAEEIAGQRLSPFLPGVPLPPGLQVTGTPDTLRDAGLVLLAAPAQMTRTALALANPLIRPDAALVLCAKGVECKTMALQSEIAATEAPGRPIAIMTGPGFATEIGAGLPTALTLACADTRHGNALQQNLSTPTLRLYLTDDLIGAQIGGAMKNVIAIACGAVTGAELGESARAALMTRGMAEIMRLALARGARSTTMAGLSGMGDLALTCLSPKSRNFALGHALGAGNAPAKVLAEGASSAAGFSLLAQRIGVEAPITDAIVQVLESRMSVGDAIRALLGRPLRME